MIRGIELGNVRIFEGDSWRFDLRPLTVFCGANSAGKSTLLKTLLVLSQSQSQKFGGRLCLSGARVDFGEFSSFVSHEDVGRKVRMATTIDIVASSSTIEFLRMQKRSKQSKSGEKDKDVARPVELRADFTFSLPSRAERTTRSGTLAKGGNSRTSKPNMVTASLESAVFEVSFEKERLLEWKVFRAEQADKTYGRYRIALPLDYFRRVGGLNLMSVNEVDNWVESIATLDGLLPQSIMAVPKGRKSTRPRAKDQDPDSEEFSGFPMPPFVQQSLWALDEAFEQVHYLGPLRTPAKRYYVAHLGIDPDMDPSGEFLPYVLRDRADQRVLNVPPGSNGKPVRQTLTEALDGWVAFLRTGEPLSEKHSGEVVLKTEQVLVQINVKSVTGTESHALADSGFGYSQVLPILVRGLLADQDSTFIIEQPELHLNPSLQVRLAEFFLSMVRAGKQVLIETHSEHIVNAIRVLTAEDQSGTMWERSRIYFIDTSTGKPSLHELSVQKDGTIPEWPRYFFGEAVELTGRLLRAQSRFRTMREK